MEEISIEKLRNAIKEMMERCKTNAPMSKKPGAYTLVKVYSVKYGISFVL